MFDAKDSPDGCSCRLIVSRLFLEADADRRQGVQMLAREAPLAFALPCLAGGNRSLGLSRAFALRNIGDVLQACLWPSSYVHVSDQDLHLGVSFQLWGRDTMP